jgi:hypothetical protein
MFCLNGGALIQERKVAIGSIVLLFLTSVSILTYQSMRIADLQSKIDNLQVNRVARAGKQLSTNLVASEGEDTGTYQLDLITAVMAVPDWSDKIPQDVARGMQWKVMNRARVHMIQGNLVVLEVQDAKGEVLPLLFQIPDPKEPATWRYLYAMAPR